LTPYWNFINIIFTDYKEIAKTKSHETKKVTKKIEKVTQSSAAINESVGDILL
jgi:hypothetical protein